MKINATWVSLNQCNQYNYAAVKKTQFTSQIDARTLKWHFRASRFQFFSGGPCPLPPDPPRSEGPDLDSQSRLLFQSWPPTSKHFETPVNFSEINSTEETLLWPFRKCIHVHSLRRVTQPGYSRDAWLADIIFCETRIWEIILHDSLPEGFEWTVKNLEYKPILVILPLYFESQVLGMVRDICWGWLRYVICNMEPSNTLSSVRVGLIIKSAGILHAYFRDLEKWNILYWWSVILYFFRL